MREQTYPEPYPDGWYHVASSHELKRGKILYRECLGTQLIVYRSDVDDSVHAMGAFCPHMGANLSAGCIKEGQVECPFHLWQFSNDGRVSDIPYADKLPPRTRQKTWPTRERYGQIFIYHDGAREGSEPAPAPYEIPDIPEIDSGRMVYRGRYAPRNVHMHILEFAENSVDFQHFSPLHGQMFVPWTNIVVPGIKVIHRADWEPDPEREHIAYFKNKAILKMFGREIERTKASAKTTFVGPAGVVTFHFFIPDAGEILMFQTHLPVAPMEQQVRFTWFADKTMPRWLVYYVVGNWVSQWRNDIDVWENKIHLPKPSLVKGDGPIHKLRKWYRQFYPDKSPPPAARPEDVSSAAE
ncbi:MAG: Rieske 2Fe-2S domain-containing protein [Myxococcota bacterium]